MEKMFKNWRKLELKRWSSIQKELQIEKSNKLYNERFSDIF